MTRTADVRRKTKETTVEVRLDLDGAGSYDVETDNPFLSHMLETWARYAGFDLRVRATGDLDHHLVEDVAITVGQAFGKAFAGAPCVRIAYDFVPMDDALVLCAVDLVDRPYYAGELPVPLWDHWFRSFAMEARINIHLEHLRGRDTHHTTEAAFKAFARALRLALAARGDEISTKGAVRATVASRAGGKEAGRTTRKAPGKAAGRTAGKTTPRTTGKQTRKATPRTTGKADGRVTRTASRGKARKAAGRAPAKTAGARTPAPRKGRR